MGKRGLTDKQKSFVQEYLIDLNASQAAIRAGYKHKDIGRQLIAKPHVQAAIQAAKDKRSARAEVTQEMVVLGLLKEAQDIDDGAPAARVSAWEKLGKHLGIFEKDNAQKGPRELVIRRETRDK